MLIVKNANSGIDNGIHSLSQSIGMPLPDELEDFLRKYNGGETPHTSFSCNGISSDIRAFYGINVPQYSFQEVSVLHSDGLSYLPIALDSFGNNILICLSTGGIFFQDHELDKITCLADSLNQFINNCKSEQIDASCVKSVQDRERELTEKGHQHLITDALRQMWQDEIDRYSSIKQEEVIL